jgi:hypothetical protein
LSIKSRLKSTPTPFSQEFSGLSGVSDRENHKIFRPPIKPFKFFVRNLWLVLKEGGSPKSLKATREKMIPPLAEKRSRL